MTHRCNVQCYTMEAQKSELLGIEDDGKWMPFVFSMEMVEAIKLTSDDTEASTYNCTTLFTHKGDTYVIDTPFEKFAKLFIDYTSMFDLESEEEDDDDDLNL
jgi:hypothetical protein